MAPWHIYAARAIGSPTSVVAMTAVALVNLWNRNIAGAAVLPIVIAMIAAELSSLRFVQRRLDVAAARRAREQRASVRFELMLTADDDDRACYRELLRAIEDLELAHPELATRMRLDDLLDRFAQIASRRQRFRTAAALAADLDTRARVEAPGAQYASVVVRRIQRREDNDRTAERLRTELAAIGDAIRRVAQHAA